MWRICWVGQTLKFTQVQLITKLYLPSALPSILTGVHLALIYSWVASVGAEYFMTVGPGASSCRTPVVTRYGPTP